MKYEFSVEGEHKEACLEFVWETYKPFLKELFSCEFDSSENTNAKPGVERFADKRTLISLQITFFHGNVQEVCREKKTIFIKYCFLTGRRVRSRLSRI